MSPSPRIPILHALSSIELILFVSICCSITRRSFVH
jgi:hypothetical protein